MLSRWSSWRCEPDFINWWKWSDCRTRSQCRWRWFRRMYYLMSRGLRERRGGTSCDSWFLRLWLLTAIPVNSVQQELVDVDWREVECLMNNQKLRQDFPILDQIVNDEPLVYLDNAATTQKRNRCFTSDGWLLPPTIMRTCIRGVHTLPNEQPLNTKRLAKPASSLY